MCHTEYNEWNEDICFKKGHEYEMETIPGQIFITCKIYQEEGNWTRFDIDSDVLFEANPVWEHYTDYFEDPNVRERERIIDDLLI